METIKNYLEMMFSRLPDTAEVRKAKAELWQMMEDKYVELMEEGKTENEAVGSVIAEFGNLDELMQDLGIAKVSDDVEVKTGRELTLEEAKGYLADKKRHAQMIAVGVMLCIISPALFTIDGNLVPDIVSLTWLFVLVALAVGLFIYSGVMMGNWNTLFQEGCWMDAVTEGYVAEQKRNFRLTYAVLLAGGVALCILSVVPVAAWSDYLWLKGFEVAVMFVLVGVSVYLIVAASIRIGGYNKLLKLGNGAGGKVYTAKKQVVYHDKRLAAVMSVYWQTVTCIYLCWSFLTFDWHISWIIWVIAALVENVIKIVAENGQTD